MIRDEMWLGKRLKDKRPRVIKVGDTEFVLGHGTFVQIIYKNGNKCSCSLGDVLGFVAILVRESRIAEIQATNDEDTLMGPKP